MQTHSKDLRYFDHNSDDVTGWSVRAADGSYIGKVARLLADAESNHVLSVVLDSGREIPAHDLTIGTNELMLASAPAKAPAREIAPEPAAELDPAHELPPAPKPALAVVEEARSEPVRAAPTPRTDEGDLLLHLVDEELDIGKRAYDAGGVHVESHLVEEPVSKQVRLHEERVTVQRTKVDRPLDAAAANELFHDQSYEVTATAELPVVKKLAHVVEEIVVKKRAFDHAETIRDTVRHMEADITELRASEAMQGAGR